MAHGSEFAFSEAVKAVQESYGVRRLNEEVVANRPWGTQVTEQLAKFIAQRDSFYFGTASKEGRPYVQHRGGARGFLKVLDSATLAFADYPGNKQFISAGNLSENDQAFIFLMDYETRQRIKLWGRARFIDGPDALLAQVIDAESDEAISERTVLFAIDTWDVNCPSNIPQRFSEETVARVVQKLTDRVTELEAKLAELSK